MAVIAVHSVIAVNGKNSRRLPMPDKIPIVLIILPILIILDVLYTDSKLPVPGSPPGHARAEFQ